MIYQKSFRMDNKERFFVQSENFGEVLLADAPRFWVLDHLDDTGKHIVLKDNQFTIKFS